MSRSKTLLTIVDPDCYKVVVLSDGTTTTAEVIATDHRAFGSSVSYQVGLGTARRRKGDPRDPDLGARLAIARAFRDAAEHVEKTIDGHAQGVERDNP